MSDRELLELAAKAAGIDVRWYQGDCLRVADKCNGFAGKWNPITDDGDALRLAVTVGLGVSVPLGYKRTDVVAFRDSRIGVVESHGSDPLAATRRAIVRAAAEIGRQMP